MAGSSQSFVVRRAHAVSRLREQADSVPVNRRYTVAEMLDAWLTHHEPHFRPKTVDECDRRIRLHLVPVFGDIYIDQVTPVMLDAVYHQWCDEMSHQSVRHLHATLSTAFNQAVKWGWVDRNPAWLASPPPAPVREMKLPTPVQFRQLYERALTYNNMLATLVALGGLTGARRGELIGLRWSDIDWEKKKLQIVRSVTQVGSAFYVGPTKTKVNRALALDASSIFILQERREYVDRRAETAGAVVGPDAYVLSEVPDGSVPVRPNKVCNNFRKLSQKSGVGIRLHDLRHFSITMLLSSGFDISTVAARHGHSHPSTMLDRYAHVLPERDREAADLLGRMLGLPAG